MISSFSCLPNSHCDHSGSWTHPCSYKIHTKAIIAVSINGGWASIYNGSEDCSTSWLYTAQSYKDNLDQNWILGLLSCILWIYFLPLLLLLLLLFFFFIFLIFFFYYCLFVSAHYLDWVSCKSCIYGFVNRSAEGNVRDSSHWFSYNWDIIRGFYRAGTASVQVYYTLLMYLDELSPHYHK